jgi:hypothetical protein
MSKENEYYKRQQAVEELIKNGEWCVGHEAYPGHLTSCIISGKYPTSERIIKKLGGK